MKKDGKEFELEKLVFRVFVKHVKANNLYIPFRWSINFVNEDKDFVHVLSRILCPNRYYRSKDRISQIGAAFTATNSITDILKLMNYGKTMTKIENTAKFQVVIMNMVNTLIHNCIEHAIENDIHILEKIGSAVFEEVGKTLFGEDFKDLTEEGIDPRQRDFMQKMQEMNNELRGFPRESYEEFIKVMRERMRHDLARRARNREETERRYFEAPPRIYDDIEELDWDNPF